MPASSLLFDNDQIHVAKTVWDSLHKAVSLTPLLCVLAAAAEAIRYGSSFVIYRDEDSNNKRTIGDQDGFLALLDEIRAERNKLGLQNIPSI